MTTGSNTPENSDIPNDLDKLVFDEWKNLFESDPEQFERYRKQLLKQQIELAPESARPRLLGLIFQMEAEALRSPTPISYSLRLSAMMMAKFEELRQKLNLLTGDQADVDAELQSISKSAEIVPIRPYLHGKEIASDQSGD